MGEVGAWLVGLALVWSTVVGIHLVETHKYKYVPKHMAKVNTVRTKRPLMSFPLKVNNGWPYRVACSGLKPGAPVLLGTDYEQGGKWYSADVNKDGVAYFVVTPTRPGWIFHQVIEQGEGESTHAVTADFVKVVD